MVQVVHGLEGLADVLKAAGFQISPIGDKPKGKTGKAGMLANKDKAIRAGFTRKGIKDVVLMDRNDRSQPFNVRPFGRPAKDGQPATGWLGQGRVVKKGETSVRGLFHVSQTEPLA